MDGFRVDAIAHLYEVNDTSMNEPKNPDAGDAVEVSEE